MSGADALLTILALGVAILLARGAHPVVRVLLVASALVVSALLFLPTQMLGGWIGIHRVHRFSELTRSTPLDLSEWIHLIAFGWLGVLMWLARRDLHNWRGVLLLTALGVAAEVSQWLTEGREPRVEDAALNVAGGLAGILFAQGCRLLAGWAGRKRRNMPTAK